MKPQKSNECICGHLRSMHSNGLYSGCSNCYNENGTDNWCSCKHFTPKSNSQPSKKDISKAIRGLADTPSFQEEIEKVKKKILERTDLIRYPFDEFWFDVGFIEGKKINEDNLKEFVREIKERCCTFVSAGAICSVLDDLSKKYGVGE